jgi:hypothetical protein
VVLDGRFDPHGPPVVTVMDAAGVVALGRVALHTGDARQVRQTSEIAKTMLNESTPAVRRHAAWLLSLQSAADGDPEEAHHWLCAMGEPERRLVLSRLWMDVADEVQMVRIAVAVDDNELAESAAADASRRAELCPSVPSLAATAAHASGLLNRDIDKLSEAVSLFKRSPRSLSLAGAYEDLGLMHQREGTADSAVDALTQALVLFARAGATRDAARLRSRLRELGIRRRVTGAEKCRWVPIDGSATFTIEASMTTTNWVIARSISARFLPRCEVMSAAALGGCEPFDAALPGWVVFVPVVMLVLSNVGRRE